MDYEKENEPKFTYKPLNKFMHKLLLEILIILVISSISFWILWILITTFSTTTGGSRKYFISADFANFALMVNIALVIVLMTGSTIISYIYTKTMSFSIYSNEIVVKKGVVNKTEKHVPFRTVTNISTRYGIFDKLFGIGTVEIETAGKSGQATGPEEKIEGINNYQNIRNIILDELRKFRSQYATATEVPEKSFSQSEIDPKLTILQELREIKEILHQKL